MRIISKFRDYYDSAQGLGIDTSLIYQRETKEILVPPLSTPVNISNLPEDIWGSYPNKDLKSRLNCIYLFFCGKIYTTLDLSLAKTGKPGLPFSSSWDDIVSFYENEVPRNRFWNIDSKLYDLQKINGKDAPAKVFEQLSSPIVLMYGQSRWSRNPIKFIVNPKLDDLGFQHIVDPYSAFQSISAYLGNELCERETPHQPSNDELIHARGFDSKTSFRSGRPSEKKQRRKRNKLRKAKSRKSTRD